MLFKAQSLSRRPLPLKPFLLKLMQGHLLGLAMDPQQGSPCADCVQKWLETRRVWSQRAALEDLRARRDLIGELISENTGHVFYEIAEDGETTRLEVEVFPHPDCVCSKSHFIPVPPRTKKTNFAFSPVYQLKSGRFGTPEGNLWLTAATGETPLSKHRITVYGVGHEKDASRFRAMDEWMKRAAKLDVAIRMGRGEQLESEVFQTQATSRIATLAGIRGSYDVMGAGETREAAILDGLFSWAKARTLKKFASQMKNPMLMVGANNWIRGKIPFFLLQEYDLHLLFYPNSTPAWVIGVAAFSRVRVDERPTFVFAADADITRAMDDAIFRALEALRPADWRSEPDSREEALKPERISKLNMWWTHWIYRCPKISLREVLHLEAYPRLLESWRDYLRDGQERVDITSLNSDVLPHQIRYLLKVDSPIEASKSVVRNINGIGTWRNFEDALL